ncbi:MAG: ABC transporter permease [Oscillospiraceae bacterium]|nr:ABC transporter permease [Oscillospiraceae bacterium]
MGTINIPHGKRPRDPLAGRVWKDILRDWKRYLMIFAMLVATIGFVSGMYVSNNSMLTALDEGVTKYHREDGHFLLSTRPDEALLDAIASGEAADVPAVLRERAYEEAEEEVRKAVDEAVEDEVRTQVKDAITAQVTAAVDEQLALAAQMGAPVPEEEAQKMRDEAVAQAMAESYEDAVSDALDEAKKSDDYKDAFADAMDEAKEEIDKEIDDAYEDLADRYGLDETFDPVPVTLYELFYKDVDEILTQGAAPAGTVRVYSERRDVDLYDILEGRAPETDSEIMIDRMHADNAGIAVGDTIYAGDTAFTVVGFGAFVDYTTLYEKNTDTMFDALTFNVAMVTDEGFTRIHSNTRANYAYTFDTAPADSVEEKDMNDRFLKVLITQVAVSEKNVDIKDFVPGYANNAVLFAPDDMGSDKAMGGVLLYILTAVLAFIFAVTISTTLEKEASVIGTLRALGYTRGELPRYYMTAPIVVVLIAAVVGNVLGYTVFKDVVLAMYHNSYSLPSCTTLWTPDAFLRTTIVPIVLMLIINLVVITRTLKLSPLRFLRHDLKRTRRAKAIRLPRWSFFKRFRLRVMLQNIPNYLSLFIGITFVMLLLSMAVGMPETLDYYKARMPKMMFAQDQVILSRTEDDDGNTITTSTEGTERFSIYALQRRSDTYNEEVSVYGLAPESRYVDMSAAKDGEVLISDAYAEKYDVAAGDSIVLSEKYENKDYTWRVAGIVPDTMGISVFLPNAQFNEAFDNDPDAFSGYLSDNMIEDIDKDDIAQEITVDDMAKMAKQLDHSMGSYMVYFQYVCVIVAAVILYLLTKMIIEKNERSISMAKILGYENGEIASLYLIPTGVIVFLSEFLAIWLGYLLMNVFWKVMMMSMGGWFAFKMSVGGFVKEFVLVFAAYLIITVLDFLRIGRIPKVLALKTME